MMQKKINKRSIVSYREYYCYKLQIRRNTGSLILHSGRLLQQYIVNMFIKLESSQLDYFRYRQDKIRADLYQGLVDSVAIGETHGSKVGHRIVLLASFIGGPRDMRHRYIDAMALVERFGKPGILLTITWNPSWSEIPS